MKKLLSCAFNMDSGCVELKYIDGSMVSWDTFEKEITHNSFTLIEKGMTSVPPSFDRLMYAVVKRNSA